MIKTLNQFETSLLVSSRVKYNYNTSIFVFVVQQLVILTCILTTRSGCMCLGHSKHT